MLVRSPDFEICIVWIERVTFRWGLRYKGMLKSLSLRHYKETATDKILFNLLLKRNWSP